MKRSKLLVVSTILLSWNHFSPCINQDGPFFQPIPINLSTEMISTQRVSTDPKVLYHAARYALQFYFESKKDDLVDSTKSDILEKNLISSDEARKTLEFIIKTMEEDSQNELKKYRMLDPSFLQKHFSCIKWYPDTQSAKKNNVIVEKDKIRLTHYVVFCCNGSPKKSEQFPCALYEITGKTFKTSTRFKYTKQEVIGGELEKEVYKNQIKPLVWIPRQGLEDALLQGSILVIMPDGEERLFNVHKNNGIAYEKKIKDSWTQKRYWYFKQITQAKNLRNTQHQTLIGLGGVAFAGDVKNLGIGKLIAFRYKNPQTNDCEFRLGILADRGGAFEENLYQLDLFAGVFYKKSEFATYIKAFPNTVEAYILKKKE